ncbi:hypothetical protein [Lentzea aerocolonigenes]|nr:hypothetical protein [Lentzea aerocolonigenes]
MVRRALFALAGIALIVAGAYSVPDINRGWSVAGFEWTSVNDQR